MSTAFANDLYTLAPTNDFHRNSTLHVIFSIFLEMARQQNT
ncbi:unnamed protein product [Larinioides sclopetarius]|uniref:Uncharacterized protein n=1 Tax=Larinioides sclopetarius TaxID=280406 RepID=A0AAV2AHK9_9ARAC